MAGTSQAANSMTKMWIVRAVALISAATYLIEAGLFARTQTPTLDEGVYLYKGLLFLEGIYKPFQPYGLWTNKMPLAFLIPGLSQRILGAGLLSGRIYAIFLSALMLLAIWIATRRLAGSGWAAAMIAALALSPALVKNYSVAVSQVLVACMLAWILALVLGEGRPRWQIVLGGLLSGALIMTRINLAPVLPLVAAYVFWQDGWKDGLWFTLAGAATTLIGHLLYWPDILQIWTPWLPASLTPFLNAWRLQAGGTRVWSQTASLFSQIFSFFEGVRLNALPVLAALVSWLLWPSRGQWKSSTQFRAAVLLSALFAVLGVIHAVAALGADYCLGCFATYIPFFGFTGLMLAAVTAVSWRRQLSVWRKLFAVALILVTCAGLGFALREEIGYQLVDQYGKGLLAMQVPRVGGLRILPGSTPLWTIIANKTGLDYPTLLEYERSLLPTAAGFLAGLALLLVTGLVRLAPRFVRSWDSKIASWGFLMVSGWLAASALLSPTPLLGGGPRPHDCSGNVPASYAQVGAYLASVIPSGSTVYLEQGVSPAILLYLPDVKIYPPQLNGTFSLYTGGDSDRLLRFGRWNDILARQWALEADVDLVSDQGYNAWWQQIFQAGHFKEVQPSGPVSACEPRSNIHIYLNEGKP